MKLPVTVTVSVDDGDGYHINEIGTLGVELEIQEEEVVRVAQQALHNQLGRATAREVQKVIEETVTSRVKEHVAPRVDALFQQAMDRVDALSDDELIDLTFSVEGL